MGLFDVLLDTTVGLARVAADGQRKPRKFKTSCTPCAANAKLEQARARMPNATYRAAPAGKVKR